MLSFKAVRRASFPKMNVQTFPRPPRLDKISRHIRITYKDVEIADTSDAYWVLETHHPPSACEPRAIQSPRCQNGVWRLKFINGLLIELLIEFLMKMAVSSSGATSIFLSLQATSIQYSQKLNFV